MASNEKISVKEEIKKALCKLLMQKNYIDITVSDLIKTAQVARISFYRNFNCIDDVVDSIADDMIENFSINIIPVITKNDERKWRELLFEMLYGAMQRQKKFELESLNITENKFNGHIIHERIKEKILQLECDVPAQSISEKYLSAGKWNFVFGIINKWTLTGMEETPEEIVNLIMSAIMLF